MIGEIDHIDRKILRELIRDGRISNLRLADIVGLSPSACLRRVQSLERLGVISGYRAVVDPVRAGIGFIAYLTAGLNDHSAEALAKFEAACRAAPEIVECHNITGSVEYLLRIEARDIEAYKRVHTDVLGRLPIISQMTTYVVMGSPKDSRGMLP